MNDEMSTVMYPCDRGTGRPIGYHHFQGAPGAQIVCIYCGATPKRTS